MCGLEKVVSVPVAEGTWAQQTLWHRLQKHLLVPIPDVSQAWTWGWGEGRPFVALLSGPQMWWGICGAKVQMSGLGPAEVPS